MQKFKKSERLCSKILIEKLIASGNNLSLFPLKVMWMPVEASDSPVKIVISVPKRNFKKAVDRNKLKRQLREAYRKNKHSLYEQLNGKKLVLMLSYSSKEKEPYQQIEKKTVELLQKLTAKINSH